jgi:glutamate/tyrosine decarboxylase-like PLP-dependent enzyme
MGQSGLDDDKAEALSIAFEGLMRYRRTILDRTVTPSLGPDEAVARFRKPLADTGIAAQQTIRQLIQDTDDGLRQMASPNFFGFVLGGSHPVGVAADLLVSAWGQNAALATVAPGTGGIERTVCDWVIDMLGLPPESGAGIVTGGSVANMVGIMAARNALLAREGWDVEEKGLYGAPEISVLIGDAAHSAPFAALRYAGLGAGRAIRVAVDSEGRILPDAFRTAIEKRNGPILAILQAGQINTGAFDPFAELIPMVHEKGGWVHVDGAFGLWLAAVPELAHGLAGVAEADSWVVDLHKWLNAPFDAGLVVCRDRKTLVASMTARGAYLPDPSGQWDPADSTPELSRRARGVASYAIMRHLGKDGIREMISRHCKLARHAAGRLSQEPGIHVLNEVAANQVAIRCGEGPRAGQYTQAVLDKVQKRGKVFPSHGVWQGDTIIRISIICHATKQENVDLLADEIIAAWRSIRGN